MSERIPQSVAKVVVFRAYLAGTATPATGKTIAITISKNGATSFSNPNAGATNATEMASGFYKFTLGTTDTNTVGPLAWRGAEGTIDDAGDVYSVVDPLVSIASGGISEASFATTAGSFSPLGVVDQGTAQSAGASSLVLRSAAGFADDELVGSTIVITGGTTGVGQSRVITDYVGATDTATVDAWVVTPTGTITYKIFGTPPGTGGLDAAGVRDAIGLASANLDEQLAGTLDANIVSINGVTVQGVGSDADPWAEA